MGLLLTLSASPNPNADALLGLRRRGASSDPGPHLRRDDAGRSRSGGAMVPATTATQAGEDRPECQGGGCCLERRRPA